MAKAGRDWKCQEMARGGEGRDVGRKQQGKTREGTPDRPQGVVGLETTHTEISCKTFMKK